MIKIHTELDRVCQGDIFHDVEYIEHVVEHEGILEISKIRFPFIIVLTQDCDLAQDYTFRTQNKSTKDKWLISVLVAPLYNSKHVFHGDHLQDIGIESEPINETRSPGTYLKENKRPRYHYIEFPNEIPNSIIDFKHYFSISITDIIELKKTNYVCTVSELYREDLSQRFAAFLSRIGLPDPSANET